VNQRFYSLDVFRGLTVAFMILVNNPGTWSHIYGPFDHAKWHGCTPTDLVFPFFLFAVGNAMAFVMPRLQQAGHTVFWTKVSKRTLLIFGIGLFILAWAPYLDWNKGRLVLRGWEYVNSSGQHKGIRILGVLQRIALCYFFASVIVYFTRQKGASYWACCLLLAYWVYCLVLGDPHHPFTIEGWFGTDIDRLLMGDKHIYNGEGRPFDPEGIMSTVPAIASVLFGYLAGDFIQRKGKTYEMLSQLFVLGAILTAAGLAWGEIFPLNKKIWTSSYVLYTTGLALTTLSLLIYLIEFRNVKGGWSRFFDVFGKNPLFIFVLSGFLPRVLGLIRIHSWKWVTDKANTDVKEAAVLSPFSWFYEHVCRYVPGRLENGSLVYALTLILFYWAIAWWMNQKKIYVKV
jgi:predicted acyltransferase